MLQYGEGLRRKLELITVNDKIVGEKAKLA